ncbi:MAG: hypothetical protein QOF18_3112 [Frankiaceae bacterium]|nr:hypothetical protein [Frankiaceae bacterium]
MHVSRRSAVALVTAAGLAALSLPAGAATTTTPAKGVATSTLTVLRLTLAGTTVAAGQIVAVAGNTTKPHLAKLVITPVDSSVTGPIGQQTVSAGGGTSTIPATPKSVTLPGGLGKVVGPTFHADAVDGATGIVASAALKALGQVQVLTVPLDLKAATLSDVSQVKAGGATAEKRFVLGGLGLPSVQDLLAALGVDLSALTQQLTQGNLTQLAGLVGGALGTLNADVDAAQAALTGAGQSAASSLAGAQQQLTAANAAVTTATNAFNTAWASAFGALAAPAQAALALVGVNGTTTADQFAALTGPTLTAVTSALSAGTFTNLSALAQSVVDAEAIVADVNALVDALQALVNAVVAAVLGSNDPLATLGTITVTTSAIAAKTPKAAAGVTVGSVHVLGLAGAIPLGSLTSALGAVTGTLSSVLESVAGVTFKAPTIAVGTPSKSTSTQGRTRFASASITGLTLTLPSITLPAALHLAGVPTGISGALTVGQLAETAQWTPASTKTTPSTPGTPQTGHPGSGGGLPDTGGRMLISVAGLLVIGSALALRRRAGKAA